MGPYLSEDSQRGDEEARTDAGILGRHGRGVRSREDPWRSCRNDPPFHGSLGRRGRGRVFVRSWNDKPTGWFRAFRQEPDGTVQLGDREISVRGVVPRGDRIREAVTTAYGEKYNTKASQKWVKGFAADVRLLTTLELCRAEW